MTMGLIGAFLLTAVASGSTVIATPAGTIISPPEVVTLTRPNYPMTAQHTAIPGCALLGFNVAANGRAENIRVLRSLPTPEFGESAVNALASWRFLPPATKTQSGASAGVEQEFRFDPSGSVFDYRGPDCGGKNGNQIIYALPAPISARTVSKPSPQRPADLPDQVNLGITRSPVTQTFAAPYGNHSWLRPGSVTMRFCVNKQGHTENLRILYSTGGGAFDKVAMTYMRAALFKPHTIQGFPVTACGITQTIVFRPAKH